jgi:hypothetical protein
LEAEINRLAVPGQPWKNVHETSFQQTKAGYGGECFSSQVKWEA